jgi:hypothetical protein
MASAMWGRTGGGDAWTTAGGGGDGGGDGGARCKRRSAESLSNRVTAVLGELGVMLNSEGEMVRRRCDYSCSTGEGWWSAGQDSAAVVLARQWGRGSEMGRERGIAHTAGGTYLQTARPLCN